MLEITQMRQEIMGTTIFFSPNRSIVCAKKHTLTMKFYRLRLYCPVCVPVYRTMGDPPDAAFTRISHRLAVRFL